MSANRARLKWKPRTKKAAPVVGNRVTTLQMNALEREAMLHDAEAKRLRMQARGYGR